jgi:DNA processing protein
MGIADQVVTRDRLSYPRRLRDLSDAPDTLWLRGVLDERPVAVAIVGSRAASGDGMAIADGLASELAGIGALVVSGGAVGIDSAAHRGALRAGGSTVAVLGGGLEAPYPARNRPLFADIVSQGGGLVTPYPPGAPPRRFHFVRRNRVIAGMVDAVVVVEAALSSGAMHTAQAAVEYGRALCAVPASIGGEQLIARGAAVVERAADVLDAIAGRPRRPQVNLPADGSDAARVFAALDDAPRSADEIAVRSGLGAREVTRALTGLELEGLALLLPGQHYARSVLAMM